MKVLKCVWEKKKEKRYDYTKLKTIMKNCEENYESE